MTELHAAGLEAGYSLAALYKYGTIENNYRIIRGRFIPSVGEIGFLGPSPTSSERYEWVGFIQRVAAFFQREAVHGNRTLHSQLF